MKIVFFGTPQNAALVLSKLISSKFRPALVITGVDVKRGRGKQLQSTPVRRVAEANDIKVLSPENLNNEKFIDAFREFASDIAILIAYGKLIPAEILAIPNFGFVNIHPSLLPKYRGPSPIYQTILAGDKKTGVTIIKLDKELDHGPIITRKELSITEKDTHDSLMTKLANVGAELLIDIMPSYLDGSSEPKQQDHTKATYTEMIKKEDGYIDLKNPPDPEKLDRMIRAYYPWPGVWTKINGKIFKFLPGNLIQPEGKKPMTIKEFFNGYPETKSLIEPLVDSTQPK